MGDGCPVKARGVVPQRVARDGRLTERVRLVYGFGVIDSLLSDVDARPDDRQVREKAARALMSEGRPADAVALLQDGFIHLNAHEPGMLPCLCRRCMRPGDDQATVGGTTYHRDFVVAPGTSPGHRVLFFWIPASLLDRRRRVLRSVATSLRARYPDRSRELDDEDDDE